ncbi:MAG: hypothetical protein RLZZ01_1333 [Actinomycetota bacterium]|jgi:hypothetical protein
MISRPINRSAIRSSSSLQLLDHIPGIHHRNGHGIVRSITATAQLHPVAVLGTVAVATVGVGALSMARHRRQVDLELLASTEA